jgi:outer membrane protein assembly factor BamB
MKIPKLRSNLISIILILLVILSNIFVFNVSAELVHYPDEGLYFDDFANEDDVTNVSCVYNSGKQYFYLKQGTPEHDYGYDITPNNIKIWETNWSMLSKGNLPGMLSQFLSPDAFLMENEISTSVKSDKLSAADNKTISTTSSYLVTKDYSQYPVHRFRVKIDQDISNIKKLTIKWWFGDYQTGQFFNNLQEIRMYLWTYGSILPQWTNPSDLYVTYSNTKIGRESAGEKLPDILYIDDGKYISEDGYLDFLVIGKPVDDQKTFKLLTDYINVSIETTYGYLPSGSLISDVIQPSNLGGWESVIWSSSRYSDMSGVTISVLDEDSKEIEGYSGKTSPLDISGVTNKKIRLKATLHSKDPQVTPYMFSWGVLYQKDLEFKDSFSNEYRIQETLGTQIDSGTIVVSNYYSQWPFFGKNSDNTRFYQGEDIGSSAAKIYWYSKENHIAGGFRAPITSEGKIYVASSDKKIYAYNMLKDTSENIQEYIDVSNELLTVESSLGIYEDYLIAATGEAGSKNKIYALNKNNLSEKLWIHPYPLDDSTICFSSNPTIYEDRLFITSWGGNIWDTAYFSFISRFIGKNNKLVAIDIKTGEELWSPIRLPAASISSPAVGNGFVYVGCQNMSGASLFAFDIENGEEMWSTNLGIIGRSSPVYADEKVFVLSNKKQNISSSGTYMLTAINANNGKQLWNISLGEFKTSSLANIIKGMTFTYKLIEGFAPISTPAYKDGTLFVLSPNGTFLALDANNNGTIKWSYDITNPLIDFSHYVTSPVVVGDMVYIITGGSVLYAFKTDYSSDDVTPAWNTKVGIPSYGHTFIDIEPTDVLASPIISDNMIIVSTTDDTTDLTGKLICIGNYVQNSQGTVKSTVIHVPAGKWWNKFNAEITNTTKNTVVFKILDKDDNDLTNWFSLSDSGYDLSGLKNNAIKLYAKLSNTNKTETKATIKSWNISWIDEKADPVFDNSSFEPGVDGWVNVDLTECSIEVEDKAYNNIKSGLDINSAKYRIGYIEKNTGKSKVSDWIQATSSVSSGVAKARIVANLERHGLSIQKYVNITFTIKDLAGNQAYSSLVTFKTDVIPPESNILNRTSFKDSYNSLVPFKAEAEDNTSPADSVSGIRYVSLMYQYSRNKSAGSWSDWRYYEDNLTPIIYSWEFGRNLESGYYKIITIALDKAGNKEDVKTSKIVEFFFDNTDPLIENVFNEVYKFIEIPSFNLELYEDYSLESLYYRLDNEVDWSEIKDDIKGKQNATVKWVLSDDKWADFTVDAEHYIYFKVKDTAGNSYQTTQGNTPKVIKDENNSQLYVDLTDFSALKIGDTYTVKANIPLDISVDAAKLFYQYSSDNKNWSEVKQAGDDITSAPFEWKFTASHGNGYYKFYTKVIDTSGAEYTSDSEIINVTLTPNAALLLLTAIAVIFVLITIFVVKKMKKQKNQ